MKRIEKMKEEIYTFVRNLDLTPEEINEVDNYVIDLIERIMPLIEIHEKVTSNKDETDLFKTLILESIKSNLE
tara:strand:- start:6833 stop:7051 length:219 start_codon:yes stop_codon:yes gene_type:complete